jgi:hypothetical protein
MAKIDDKIKQLESLNAELRRKLTQYLSGSLDEGAFERAYEKIEKKQEKLKDEISNIGNISSQQSSKIRQLEKDFDKMSNQASSTVGALGTKTKQTGDFLSDFFGSMYDGLNRGQGGWKQMNTSLDEFSGTLNILDGQNIEFWREYHRRIREVGVAYGLSGQRLEEFKESNLELERSFVATGLDVTQLKDGISGLYDVTGQVNQLSPEFAKNLGNISSVMNMTTGEVGRFMGEFKNLNVSFGTTTKLLEDLRYSAEKSALNTNQVLKKFTDNFADLNKYSFRNGVQGMMDMVKQSTLLKSNMNAVLTLSDKLIDPEQTMEFAANMQLLGGSFSQLGDFNQLMYDAAVAPEELQKNIAKAAASLGTFEEKTGRLDLSFVDRMQLKQLAAQTGQSEKELMNMSTTLAKIDRMKYSINIPDLTEDQMNVLGAMAEFDTERGEYMVKVGGETKSVAELSKEDIDKISEVKEDQTFENLRVSRMDTADITATNLILGQYSTLDMFKVLGLDNEKIKEQSNETMKVVIDSFHQNVKKGIFEPIEDFASTFAESKVTDFLKEFTNGFIEFEGIVKNVTKDIKLSDAGKIIDEILGGFMDYLEKETSKTEKGESIKHEDGGILVGKSHSEGGIPFTVGGRPGFEAEGGEVLLTKGVSQNSELLSAASNINEMAGGKKLFAKGGVVTKGDIQNNDFDTLIRVVNDSSLVTDYFLEKIDATLNDSRDILNKNNEELIKFSSFKPLVETEKNTSQIVPNFEIDLSSYKTVIDDAFDLLFSDITKTLRESVESVPLLDLDNVLSTVRDISLGFKDFMSKKIDDSESTNLERSGENIERPNLGFVEKVESNKMTELPAVFDIALKKFSEINKESSTYGDTITSTSSKIESLINNLNNPSIRNEYNNTSVGYNVSNIKKEEENKNFTDLNSTNYSISKKDNKEENYLSNYYTNNKENLMSNVGVVTPSMKDNKEENYISNYYTNNKENLMSNVGVVTPLPTSIDISNKATDERLKQGGLIQRPEMSVGTTSIQPMSGKIDIGGNISFDKIVLELGDRQLMTELPASVKDGILKETEEKIKIYLQGAYSTIITNPSGINDGKFSSRPEQLVS